MQAVILCGGLGTRLRATVPDRPKSLAKVGGRPFLDYIVASLRDAGITKLLLLTGHGSEAIERWAAESDPGIELAFSRESLPLGTGGALLNGWDRLEEEFYLLNGDTFFDLQFPLLSQFIERHRPPALVALRFSESLGRYGSVEISPDGFVMAFTEKGATPEGVADGYINAGTYYFQKSSLARYRSGRSNEVLSLERDILPSMVAESQLRAVPMGGLFIDIGVPEDFERAQAVVPNRIRENRAPATFVDRDGVLIRDTGYPSGDEIEALDMGKRIVRDAREEGKLVIVVTNQAGIAKGKFSLEDYERGTARMRELYAREGLQFDAIYYCPYHADGVRYEYRKVSLCRKPKPGMILKACEDFRIDLAASTMVGNAESDRIELFGLRSVLV